MVYSIHKGGQGGGRILPNSRAVVLQQCGQCRWAGGVNGWLICVQQPRSKRISCKGQVRVRVNPRLERAREATHGLALG